MDSIRVSSNIKKIEVNDNGDYITLNFNDRSFPSKFYSLMDQFESKKIEVESKLTEISSITDETEKTKEMLHLDMEIHKWLSKEVDNIFGEDTCKKVFGNVIPNIFLYVDFFDQITPFFVEYVNFQKQLSSKYSPRRDGNTV